MTDAVVNTVTDHGAPRSRPLDWLWELLVLAGLAVPATALFWLSDFDLVVAGLFYFPGHEDGPWPLARWWLWDATYRFVPLAGAAITLAAAILLAIATVCTRLVRTRLAAGTLLLTLLLGPGLLVNVIFKDHWGHPRPRQVVEFGGAMEYQPPLRPAFGQEGRSFPCGHCSVGFSLLAFWFILKRRRRRLAWVALALGTAAGLFTGVARMAAGAHFLSDVLWSGFLVFFAAWVTYYLLLGVPARADRESIVWPERPARRWLAAALYMSLAAVFLAITALRTPFRADLTYLHSGDHAAAQPRALVVAAEGMTVAVELVAGPTSDFKVVGDARGTGLPGSSVESIVAGPSSDESTLTYTIADRGTITKRGGQLRISVPTGFEAATISAARIDLDTAGTESTGLPRLELRSTAP